MQQLCDSGVREFSTSVPARPNLLERWLGFAARNIHTVRPRRPAISLDPQFHARSRSVEGFTLVHVTAAEGGNTLVREASDIASDGRDQFSLEMSVSGELNVLQFGRRRRIEPSSYTLVSTSDPFVLEPGKGARDSIAFLIPSKFVIQRIADARRFCLRMPSGSAGLQNLIFGTVDLFQKNAWNLTEVEFLTSARTVADLILFSLNDSADISSDEHSVRAANLAFAKHVIRKRLAEPELKLSDIAQDTGLSLSYLHRLFREEGRTIHQYLKEVRLRKARELLAQPSLKRTTITDISFRCGFSDTSYFSRAFKELFGLSPSDVLRGQ